MLRLKLKRKRSTTLEQKTGRLLFVVFLTSALLFCAVFIVLVIGGFRVMGRTITDQTATYIARELNSPGFLMQMGIQSLEELDPNSPAFLTWSRHLNVEGIPMKTNDAVVQLEKPIQLIDITILGRTMYTNRDHSIQLLPFLHTATSGGGINPLWRLKEYCNYMSSVPIYSRAGRAIGEISVRIDPELFVIGISILIFVYLVGLVLFIMTARYLSRLMAGPIVQPLAHLEARIRAMARGEQNRALDGRIELVAPLKEIESLAEATNLVIDRMRSMTVHDALTGIYNRAFFEDEIQRLETLELDSLGIVMCDLDNLKQINDRQGHKAGDAMLIGAARIIRDSLRQGDIVARIGGDEFAVFIKNCCESDLELIAGRIRSQIEKYNRNHSNARLSISVGSAMQKGPQIQVQELFKEADQNMYIAKRTASAPGSGD